MDQGTVDGATGSRMTRHRRAVLRALAGLPGPATAHAIHRGLRAGGGRIGLTTVYRQLSALVDLGVAGTTRDREGRHLFHLKAGDAHDHHLICARCGRGVRVDASVVLRWATEAAAAHGFTDVTVSAELVGLCPGCLAGRATVTPRR